MFHASVALQRRVLWFGRDIAVRVIRQQCSSASPTATSPRATTSASAWGWRVPFWASIVMVAIGLYIRLGVETPTFSRLVAENRIEKAPALEVIKRQPKEIIPTALARMG
jgi:hypothetical protein